MVAVPEGQEPLTFSGMQDFLKGRGLRMQAIPERLEIVEVVPRNPAGKIQKPELRAQYS